MFLPTKKVSSEITCIRVRSKECLSCRKQFFLLHEDEIEASTTGLILSSDDNKLESIATERLNKKLKKSLNENNTDHYCPHCLSLPKEYKLKRQLDFILGSLLIGVLLGGGLCSFIVPLFGFDVNNIIYYMVYSALTVALIVYILANIIFKPDFSSEGSSRTLKASMKISEFQEWVENHEHPVLEWYQDIYKEEKEEEEETIIDLGIDDPNMIDNKIPSTKSLLEKMKEHGIQSLMFKKSYFGF